MSSDPAAVPEPPQEHGTTDRLDDLVGRAVAGDRASLDAVLRILRPLVVRYCAARLGRRPETAGEVEDVAQEVLLAVLRALPRYRDEGRPFLAFVYGIAAHKVVDGWRRSGRASRLLASEPDAGSGRHARSGRVDEPADPADGPEALALRRDGDPALTRSIGALPARQREILLLRVVVGLSADETAAAVGSTPGAVRVAQHRALTRLRADLGPADPRVSGATGDPELDALLADAQAALRELG